MNELQLPTKIKLPIKPKALAPLPKIETVPTPSLLPSYNYQAIQHKKQQEYQNYLASLPKTNYKALTGIWDPNDPYVLNSGADTIFNRKAKERRYGKFAKVLHKIPVLGDFITSIPASIDVSIVQPLANIFTGNWKAAGINTLTSFSESIDILANPVKSLITPLVNKNTTDPKYNMPWYKRLGAGFGFTKEGRYNYDYDTGNWGLDFVLEFVSDPLNWISFIKGLIAAPVKAGAKEGIKAGAKAGTKEVVEELAQQAGKKAAQEGAEALGKQVIKEGTEALGEQVGKDLAQEAIEKGLKEGAQELGEQVGKDAVGNIAEQTGKNVIQGVTEQAGKDTAEGMSEKTLKKIAKATEKRYKKQLIEDIKNIRKTGVSISQTGKAVAKEQKDPVLKKLVSKLDDALLKSKGIVDDEVIGIVNQITNHMKTFSSTAKNSKNFQNLVKHLKKFTEVKEYTLKDLLGKTVGSFDDTANIVLNKQGKAAQTELLDKLKIAIEQNDAAAQVEIREGLRNLFSDPAMIKKYHAKINLNSDVYDLLDDIKLTDYVNSMNNIIQTYGNFRILNALDKLGEAAEVVDRIILRFALLGSPITQAVYFAHKAGLFGRLGKSARKFLISKLKHISDWTNEKTITQALFETDTVLEASRRTINQFSIFSGEELKTADFSQAYAQNVYDKTLSWARGFGTKDQYAPTKVFNKETGLYEEVQKPVNILLLSPEERKAQIVANLGPKFFAENDVTTDNIDELFFKKLNEYGHYGRTGNELQAWDLETYVKSIQVDDATAQLQRLYADFTSALPQTDNVLKSHQSFIKFIADIDTPTAKTTLATVRESVLNYTKGGDLNAVQKTIIEDFKKAADFNLAPKNSRAVANDVLQLTELAKDLEEQYTVLEVLRQTNADYSQIKVQTHIIQDTLTSIHARATDIRTNLQKVPKDLLKKSEFAEQYKQIQKLISPYFGKKEVLVENSKVLYELRGNARYITQRVLENKEFQDFVNTFRAGNDGAQLLDANIAEAQARIARIEGLLKDDLDMPLENQTRFQELIKQEQEAIDNVIRVKQFFKSIDNYVEQMALLKQSGMPEMMQEVYLDTLQNFDVKDAADFLQNFDRNLTNIIHQMDIGLAGRYQTHHFTLEYYATKLLRNPEYAAQAQKYLQSPHTAIADAEFTEVLFKSELLPELSKTRTVTIDGKEVTELVNSKWREIKNRTFVYLDFETTGNNASLDQIYDIGIHCPDRSISWSYSHADFNKDYISEEAKRKLAQRGIDLDTAPDHNEVNALLGMYNQLKTLSDTNDGKEFVFLFQNSQNFNADYINTRFIQAEELAQAQGNFDLFGQLQTARAWINNQLQARSLSNVDLLKQFEGIPSVGRYYYDIKRLLLANAQVQADAGSTMMLYLHDDIFDLISKIPQFDSSAYKEVKDAVVDIMHSCNNAKYTWSARMGNVAIDGTYLIDGDIYKPSKDLIFNDDSSIDRVLQSNEVYVPDKTELLELKDNRWYYKNQALPENIATSNDAVKYLKTQNIEYAPSWRALNLRQQLSTYPVLINGNVSLQTIEGITPVAFRRYVDTDLIRDFFDVAKMSITEQHTLTRLSQKMSNVLSKIKNTHFIDDNAEFYIDLYNKVLNFAKDKAGYGAYRLLKNNTDLYHKYAVLVILARDNSPGNPSRFLTKKLLPGIKDESYKKAIQAIWTPQYFVYPKSKFAQIFDDYDAVSRVRYHNNAYSRSEFLEYIYDSEQKGMTYHARNLKEAFKKDNNSILNATESLKRGLDANNVYTPVLQKHGTIGQAHIDLNNTYIEVLEEMRDGLEFDTFIACDKQIINNLEDLLLEQVLHLNPKDLTSFVYHQGKGVVVIPVTSYLTDTTKYSFDLKDNISAFSLRYQNYEDEFIKVIKKDGDLIIYAKDYKWNMHQKKVPYKPLKDIDYASAFEAAYGIPADSRTLFDSLRLGVLDPNNLSPSNPAYLKAVENSTEIRKALLKTGISAKQLEFYLTHYDAIKKLERAHLKHHNTLKQLALDYDDQYSYMLGGYGRIMDSSAAKELADALPDEVRLSVFGDELPEKAFYNTSEHMFNFSVLGRAAYRKSYEHFATSSYQSLMSQTYRALNNNISTVAQYGAFYYNQSPWAIQKFFDYATPEEMFAALKASDNYTVSFYGVTKKGLPQIEAIPINSVEDIKYAISKNAIVTPNSTFGSIAQTINNKRWANSKFKIFHKLNYFLKASMLVHPGFIFRNFIDSTLKNYIVTKDATTMTESYIDAMNYYTKYKETINMLFAINPDSPFRPDTLKIVFADSTVPLSEDMFMLIHNFIESGPSAGSTGKVADFYLKKAATPSLVNQIYDNLLLPTKGLEQITRLAEYLEFIKKGLTNTEAFEVVTKTHFDYASKTGVTRLLELVIPFYSFQAKNFEFWLEFMNKNPVIAYNLVNYFQSTWNWEEIDFTRIDAYQSQLNHMLQGNIQLNKQGLTLKINPSFMDPINLIANPLESLSGRVSPIFKPIVDAIQDNDPYNYEQLAGTTAGAALSLIPGAGAVGAAIGIGSQYSNRLESGYRSYQRTGSVLPLIAPSIFGSVKTPAQYGRASYTNSRAFRDPQMRQPRRVNIYNKLYTDTGKNRWKLRYLPIDNFTVQWRIRESTNLFR